jgi:hypothetical protein
MAVPKARTV